MPLFRVWRERRDADWPTLLGYWGLPNLQVINCDAHAEKTAAEAATRRRSGAQLSGEPVIERLAGRDFGLVKPSRRRPVGKVVAPPESDGLPRPGLPTSDSTRNRSAPKLIAPARRLGDGRQLAGPA